LIFDRQKVLTNLNRARALKFQPDFFKTAASDLIERLQIIDKDYAHVLDIGCRWGLLTAQLKSQYKNAKIISTDISQKMLDSFEHDKKSALDEENIIKYLPRFIPDFTGKYFDLISFSLGLHKINDVQGFLQQINYLLADDGIFIGNFIGGESLKGLRFKIFKAEEQAGTPHHPHIAPFIHFDHTVMLLQNAGFAEVVVDYENIDLEFASPLKLMQRIKQAGESNALLDRANYSLPKTVYRHLSNSSEKFTDRLQLISFVASKSKNTIKLKSSNT